MYSVAFCDLLQPQDALFSFFFFNSYFMFFGVKLQELRMDNTKGQGDEWDWGA